MDCNKGWQCSQLVLWARWNFNCFAIFKMITEEMIKRESRQYDCKVIHGLRLERKGDICQFHALDEFILKRFEGWIRRSVNVKFVSIWNRITPDLQSDVFRWHRRIVSGAESGELAFWYIILFKTLHIGDSGFVLIIFELVTSHHVLKHSLHTKLPMHDSRLRIWLNENYISFSHYRYRASRV